MSNTPESSIAGPSQQNPDDESPQEYTPISSLDNVSSLMNPPDRSVMTFSFQVRPAVELRRFIEILCVFGVAVLKVHASELGLEISDARFHETEWNSFEMPASDLMGFQYGTFMESTEPQIVHLPSVLEVLNCVELQDTLTIYQLDRFNNRLSIMCETSKPRSSLSFNFPSINLNLPLEHGQQLNPPDDNIKSFSFQPWFARVLKRGIHVLCDSGVNGLGLAYIHADNNGFQITVDTKDGCAGILLFPADTLQNFQCKPSTVAQIVNLAEVSWTLTPVDEEDTITMYQVDGSNQLSFKFDCGSVQNSVAILSTNVYNFPGFIGKFPRIVTYCEGQMCDTVLKWAIEGHEIGADDIVLLEIDGKNAIISAISGDWNADFQQIKDLEKKNPGGKKYYAWFQCTFVTTLKAACEMLVHAEVKVSFSLVPKRHVVFQFNPRGGGTLLILKRALAFYPDVDDKVDESTGRFKVTDLRN